jgi:TadE-like protein
MRGDLRPQAGQATVELVLALPFLALLLAGLVQVGWVVSEQVRLWHGAREAARVAAVEQERSAVRAAAERSGLAHLSLGVEPQPLYRVAGQPVTVRLAYRPGGDMPLTDWLLSELELKAEATMRIEQP